MITPMCVYTRGHDRAYACIFDTHASPRSNHREHTPCTDPKRTLRHMHALPRSNHREHAPCTSPRTHTPAHASIASQQETPMSIRLICIAKVKQAYTSFMSTHTHIHASPCSNYSERTPYSRTHKYKRTFIALGQHMPYSCTHKYAHICITL